MLIKEKLDQAVRILDEYGIDCWITFVRESQHDARPDAGLPGPGNVTWHSAFVVSASARPGHRWPIDQKTIDDIGAWDHVIGYVEGFKAP